MHSPLVHYFTCVFARTAGPPPIARVRAYQLEALKLIETVEWRYAQSLHLEISV
jgi:hypothetical protein